MLLTAFTLLTAAQATIEGKPRVFLYTKDFMIVIKALWPDGFTSFHAMHTLEIARIKMTDEDIMKYFVDKANREYKRHLESRKENGEEKTTS